MISPLWRLALLSVCLLISLLVFQSGFLLKRNEVYMKSSCGDAKVVKDSCWLPNVYNRVVVLIVDALRYDFLIPMHNNGGNSHYLGQMTHVSELLNNGACIGTVLADPPTTTLQRIKALTTGTFPTFIDAGDNFSPDAVVNEDNFLSQAKARNVNVSFYGDSTWLSLYPEVFSIAKGFDSFDINDLDTVDQNVAEFLLSEVRNDNNGSMSLTIGHVLGVDHCGHKHGPSHPVMSHILRRTDKLIGDVANSLGEKDILVVLGDHGMTSTGDHGGDSDQETHAGILVYSPNHQMTLPQHHIRQIDLVPTLSLLLGLPIPYSNLGIVIRSLLPEVSRDKAVALNYEQMKRFADTYASLNNFDELIELTQREASTEQDQIEMMLRLQSRLREAWTQFDFALMRAGVLGVAEASLFLLSGRLVDLPDLVLRTGCLLLQAALLIGQAQNGPAAALLMMVQPISIAYSIVHIIIRHVSARNIPISRLFCGVALVLQASSFLSNSFVVYEAHVIRYLLQGAIFVRSVEKLSSVSLPRRNKSIGGFRLLFQHAKLDIICTVLALLLLRTETWFHRCREEEVGCETHYPAIMLGTLSPDARLWRAMFAAGCFWGFQYWICSQIGRFTANSTLRLGWVLSRPVLVLLGMHQLVMIVLSEGGRPSFQMASQIIAQLIYAITFAVCMIALFSTVQEDRLASMRLGLYALSWPWMLLLGDGLQPALIVCALIALCIGQLADRETLPTLLSMLCALTFYHTGHSPSLSAIPWQAAFTGVAGNITWRLIPGALVLFHMFGAQLLASLALCLHPLASLTSLCSLIAASSQRTLAVCVAALIHRRHLMVWKIFAPKFIFESVGFIILTSATVVVAFATRKTLPKE